MGEVRALGDFPDYAKLSGVPLPQPYPECNIERAIPRPYRPFRWAYHQTMCGSVQVLFLIVRLISMNRSPDKAGAGLVVGA